MLDNFFVFFYKYIALDLKISQLEYFCLLKEARYLDDIRESHQSDINSTVYLQV